MLTKRDVEFFRPLWRRIAVVVLCLALTVWELSNGETLWAGISFAIAAYGAWVFFVSFDKDNGAR
ncbi:hypothetical protein MNBD_ALPHA09-583 [hydrothermal vent metagenome]|uniref:DUF3329 domain-containing protein n=1 Tax=hydrothermal vent metagenome TaxID=652676 RepID=A0A3B0UHP4_9ZZZZ